MERVLATARLFLGCAAVFAAYMDPADGGHPRLTYALLALFLIYSGAISLLVRMRRDVTPGFSVTVHTIDVLWPAAISWLTEGPNSPFFLLFFFALMAAAFRWGFLETVLTSALGICFLLLEGLAFRYGMPGPLPGGQFATSQLIIRATYLLIAGLLLGYLAEKGKQLRAENALITRIMGKARIQSGLLGTMREVMGMVMGVFGARQALVAVLEAGTGRLFLWDVRPIRGTEDATAHFSECEYAHRDRYLFESPAKSMYMAMRKRIGRGPQFRVSALDQEGRRLRQAVSIPGEFFAAHPCNSMMALSFDFGGDWSGRLFLLDAQAGSDRELELRVAQNIALQVGPAIYSVYLLGRLRSRAGAMERARVARELHDGAIQSLIGLEMELEVLRQQAAPASAHMASELARLQKLLKGEVLNLRELMQQMKTLVLILREALVNIRKHSGAQNVLVRFESGNGCWKLGVDDDGRGFSFSGHLSDSELKSGRKGPTMIKERVRSIGGQLTIDSNPGHGARLEITVPHKAHAAHG